MTPTIMIVLSLGVGIFVGILPMLLRLHGDSWSTSTKKAITLLKRNEPERWNEVRTLNPQWIPDLTGLDLSKVKLPGVDFSGAILSAADLTGADLDSANLSGAHLRDAILQNANLRYALLDEVDIRGANLTHAILTGASLRGTDLHSATGVRLEQVVEEASLIRHKIEEADADTPWKRADLLYKLNPRQFEQFVARLFRQMGYEVQETAPSKDGGYDLILRRESDLGLFTYLVEAKRYDPARPVGISSVRALLGVVETARVTSGILVTTSRFTKEAHKFAEHFPYRIKLADFDIVKDWLREFPVPLIEQDSGDDKDIFIR